MASQTLPKKVINVMAKLKRYCTLTSNFLAENEKLTSLTCRQLICTKETLIKAFNKFDNLIDNLIDDIDLTDEITSQINDLFNVYYDVLAAADVAVSNYKSAPADNVSVSNRTISPKHTSRNSNSHVNDKPHTARAGNVNNTGRNTLPIGPKCNSEHLSNDCPSFLESSPKARNDLTLKQSASSRCLHPEAHGHSCLTKCTICSENHHKPLHSGDEPPTNQQAASAVVTNSTTKTRIVLNASAKTTPGIALNDALLNGSKIQNDLSDLLLNFKFNKISISAVLKTFRQINVDPPDWNLQRVLWRNSPEPMQGFALPTVTYGLKPATFLAVRTLHQQTTDECTGLLIGSHVPMSNDDDFLYSSPNLHAAKQFTSELNDPLTKGGFLLREWVSNDKSVLSDLSDHLLAKSGHTIFESKAHGAASYIRSPNEHGTYTVNTFGTVGVDYMLSVICSLIDPLRLSAPCIITCKLSFQGFWDYPLDWDQPRPPDIALKWQVVFTSLIDKPTFNVPRCILPSAHSLIEFHGSSDSSLIPYGAASYVRSPGEHGTYTVTLPSAKSKVLPSNVKCKGNTFCVLITSGIVGVDYQMSIQI
ncbi:hypothetical protein R5R35_009437 [Gryllus longicercus]|uniref:Uncharacterized protein n=1 Tax=Gryllus longicercus TaxID=2509291 RepID=A0AAN9Z7W8_9ORTH